MVVLEWLLQCAAGKTVFIGKKVFYEFRQVDRYADEYIAFPAVDGECPLQPPQR